MELIIDIHEKDYQSILNSGQVPYGVVYAIMNGTPLDKHDEEVIADTVESIWGKPPYMDILDKIRAEINRQEFFDAIKDAVYEGMKKFYEETGDDCKTYHQITKEAAERM